MERRRPDLPPAAVAVRTGLPLTAVVDLLAAQASGAVPVVLAGEAGGPSADGSRTGPARLGRSLSAARRRRAAEPWLALPTSGSTGTPRLVVRSCRSWACSLDAFTEVSGITGDDLVLATGPLSSTMTLFAVWHALATGVPVLAPGRWRGVMAAGPAAPAATVAHAVPTVLGDLLDGVTTGALPRLRRVVVAGAATPPGLRRRAGELGVRLVEYYGAAELSFVAADRDGTGLRAFPGAELDVRDGLVTARSPYLADGYLDGADPGPLRRDADGWACVGDRGLLVDGVLTVLGRGDAAVTVGGETVLVCDVEAALREVPGVRDVACAGIPHPRLGELLVAVVEPEPDQASAASPTTSLTASPTAVRAAVRAAAREHLRPAARPVRVLVGELPRSPGGKVDRSALRARFGERPAPADPRG
ncbi:MAG: acyl--CoA ligase [Actinomycetales bacterium]|nr:acyl--CoA ligase [Actinomycetales bacterium]